MEEIDREEERDKARLKELREELRLISNKFIELVKTKQGKISVEEFMDEWFKLEDKQNKLLREEKKILKRIYPYYDW